MTKKRTVDDMEGYVDFLECEIDELEGQRDCLVEEIRKLEAQLNKLADCVADAADVEAD